MANDRNSGLLQWTQLSGESLRTGLANATQNRQIALGERQQTEQEKINNLLETWKKFGQERTDKSTQLLNKQALLKEQAQSNLKPYQTLGLRLGQQVDLGGGLMMDTGEWFAKDETQEARAERLRKNKEASFGGGVSQPMRPGTKLNGFVFMGNGQWTPENKPVEQSKEVPVENKQYDFSYLLPNYNYLQFQPKWKGMEMNQVPYRDFMSLPNPALENDYSLLPFLGGSKMFQFGANLFPTRSR